MTWSTIINYYCHNQQHDIQPITICMTLDQLSICHNVNWSFCKIDNNLIY